MKRVRRNAISYGEIDECIDKNGNTLKVGDNIIYNNESFGPITKILNEFNLSDENPIKYLVYVGNIVYPYKFIIIDS